MATATTTHGGLTSAPSSPFTTGRNHALRDIDFSSTRGAATADIMRGGLAPGVPRLGPSVAYTAGKRVALQAQATARGSIVFETSSDGGTTWPISLTQDMTAGIAHYALITPQAGSTHYRVRFVSDAWGHVDVTSQQIT